MPTPHPYTKKDGTTVWRVRFRHGGRGTRETTETFPTARQAHTFARDIDDLGAIRALQRLEETLHRDDAITVDQAAALFLTWKAPRVRSDRTIADYERDYRLWIRPTFGHRPVALVTADDVRAWIDGMVDGTIQRGNAK